MGDPNNDAVIGPMRPTPHLEALPAIVNVMAGLTGLGCPIGRARLMRIDIESEVKSHVDTNRYWWDHLRVHIPIITDPAVLFHVDDESIHMEPGSCWVFDTWEPHRVENPVNAPRIHLVIDTVGGAGFWSLIDRQTGAADANSPLPQVQQVTSIAFETMNQPTVMPSAEIDQTLANILHQFAEVDLDRAVELDRALIPFRRSWKACWAHFGEHPQGFDSYAKLRDEADAIVDPYSQALPNTVKVNEATRQLVLRPSVTQPGAVATPSGMGTSPAAAPGGTPAPAAASAPAAPAMPTPKQIGEPITLDRPVFIISSPRSGSTMLFEAMMRAKESYTIGGESHQLIEAFPALAPASHGWDSNRLTEEDLTPEVVEKLSGSFVRRLKNRDGEPVQPGSAVRMS